MWSFLLRFVLIQCFHEIEKFLNAIKSAIEIPDVLDVNIV